MSAKNQHRLVKKFMCFDFSNRAIKAGKKKTQNTPGSTTEEMPEPKTLFQVLNEIISPKSYTVQKHLESRESSHAKHILNLRQSKT